MCSLYPVDDNQGQLDDLLLVVVEKVHVGVDGLGVEDDEDLHNKAVATSRPLLRDAPLPLHKARELGTQSLEGMETGRDVVFDSESNPL